MDRELVLLALIALACGPVIAASTWCASPRGRPGAILAEERRLWRALFRPLLPAGLLVAGLLGWAVVEPAVSDERVPLAALPVIVPFAVVCLRALWRAVETLRLARAPGLAATIGLLRPRVTLSRVLRASLDERGLRAVLEHENAHARHRDPLRVWVAQVATDLQWPWTGAARRFEAWRETLELVRDEEARRRGVDGADLAAAILTALRLGRAVPAPGARLGSDPRKLQRRIRRLLAPLESDPDPTAAAVQALRLLPWAFAACFVLGTLFGEAVVRSLLARL